jgi:hypothetical protein
LRRARAGKRVLVLERNDQLGGAATVYRHGLLDIEVSLHEMDRLDRDDPKLPLLKSLGLDRRLEFVDVGDLHEVRSPLLGEPFRMPHGVEAAFKAATQRFPRHEAALREYFDRLSAARAIASEFGRHRDDGRWWLTHAPHALRATWTLLKEGRATLGEVLTELFGGDEAVKLALAANLGRAADPGGGRRHRNAARCVCDRAAERPCRGRSAPSFDRWRRAQNPGTDRARECGAGARSGDVARRSAIALRRALRRTRILHLAVDCRAGPVEGAIGVRRQRLLYVHLP